MGALVTTYSRVGTLDHTGQKGRLVREILDAQSPETRDTLVGSSHGPGASARACRFAHHLGVHAWQSKCCDIRYDDKGSGEDTLVSCFGSLDNLSPKNDIETRRQRKQGKSVR
jgi:hypothetical protein